MVVAPANAFSARRYCLLILFAWAGVVLVFRALDFSDYLPLTLLTNRAFAAAITVSGRWFALANWASACCRAEPLRIMIYLIQL